jgi:hypothetical protein
MNVIGPQFQRTGYLTRDCLFPWITAPLAYLDPLPVKNPLFQLSLTLGLVPFPRLCRGETPQARSAPTEQSITAAKQTPITSSAMMMSGANRLVLWSARFHPNLEGSHWLPGFGAVWLIHHNYDEFAMRFRGVLRPVERQNAAKTFARRLTRYRMNWPGKTVPYGGFVDSRDPPFAEMLFAGALR